MMSPSRFHEPPTRHCQAEIAQDLRQTARHIQLLELPAGIERDEPSIGRPKRSRRDNRRPLNREEGEPPVNPSRGPRAARSHRSRPHECQMTAVRRQAEISRSRRIRRSAKSGSASGWAQPGRSRMYWYATGASVASSNAAAAQPSHACVDPTLSRRRVRLLARLDASDKLSRANARSLAV